MKKLGTLYIVASPIGNLEDITLRALRILKDEVDMIFCEDTRNTKKLLNHYSITAPLQSLHEHSSEKKINRVIDFINEGKNIAYLTDSGTPGISDPGNKLVRKAYDNMVSVVALPGPSALSTMLSITGSAGKNVLFAGFIGKKEGKIKKQLEEFKKTADILVLYESPYRIEKCINILYQIFPNSDIIIAREMTKLHEEIIHGSLSEIYQKKDSIIKKGEFTLALVNKEP